MLGTRLAGHCCPGRVLESRLRCQRPSWSAQATGAGFFPEPTSQQVRAEHCAGCLAKVPADPNVVDAACLWNSGQNVLGLRRLRSTRLKMVERKGVWQQQIAHALLCQQLLLLRRCCFLLLSKPAPYSLLS